MSDNRVRIWFALFVLVVFCAGLAGGVLIDRALGRRAAFDRGGPRGAMDFGPGGPGPGGPGPGGGPGGRGGGPPPRMLVERLAGELNLTSEQRTKVEEILTARRARLETVQREVRERFETEQQALRDEIRAVLTPDSSRSSTPTSASAGVSGAAGRRDSRLVPSGRPSFRRCARRRTEPRAFI